MSTVTIPGADPIDEPRETGEDGARLDVGVAGFDSPPSARVEILRRVDC